MLDSIFSCPGSSVSIVAVAVIESLTDIWQHPIQFFHLTILYQIRLASIGAKLIGVDSWVSLRYYQRRTERRGVVTTGHTGLCLPLHTHTKKHTKTHKTIKHKNTQNFQNTQHANRRGYTNILKRQPGALCEQL